MVERAGGVYARMDGRANTRQSQRRPRKGYVKGVPGGKIHQFILGDKNVKFDKKLELITTFPVQIKNNALEAARQTMVKTMTKAAAQYIVRINVYPHHVLRENAMATGAGADRFQEGMSRSFGTPLGTAARVKKGQTVATLFVKNEKLEFAKDAMRKARMKLPIPCYVLVRPADAPKRVVQGTLDYSVPKKGTAGNKHAFNKR